jgi:hypothetical protein
METQDTSGFYKQDPESGTILHAPNFVYARDYTLLRADHATYTLPVDGWHWFNTLKQAEAFYDITADDLDDLASFILSD